EAVELFLTGSRGLEETSEEGKYVRQKHARRRIQLSNDAAKEYEEDPNKAVWLCLVHSIEQTRACKPSTRQESKAHPTQDFDQREPIA
ncbi:unnamed protein product, partial [Musa acuminata subsp. burmannicoides]